MTKLLVLIVAVLGGGLLGIQYYFFHQVLSEVRGLVQAYGAYQEDVVQERMSRLRVDYGERGIDSFSRIVASDGYTRMERQMAQMALWSYRRNWEGPKRASFRKLIEVTAVDLRLDVADMEIEYLLEFLQRADPAYRIAACRGMGLLPPGKAGAVRGALEEHLAQDPFLPVRGAAARALGSLGVEAAIPGIQSLLEALQPGLVRDGMAALARMPGAKSRQLLEKMLKNHARVAAPMLAERGEKEAIPALEKGLATKVEEDRLAVARALADLGASSGLEELRRALAPGPTRLRVRALEVAAGLEDEAALLQAIDCADDSDRVLRQASARFLGSHPAPLAAATLKALLTDQDPEVRIAAIEAIADRKDQAFESTLRDLVVRGGDETIQIPAIRGAAALGDRTLIPLLRTRLEKPDVSDGIAHAIWEALRHLQGYAPEVSRRRQTLFESRPPLPF